MQLSGSSSKIDTTPMATVGDTNDISSDLTWVDMLKGIAIVGVFLDNWMSYMRLTTTPGWLYSLAKTLALAVGPFVDVFFILSGFGLTVAYFRQQEKMNWSWKRWVWRRVTKVVIPYEIAVILSFGLGLIGVHLYASVNVEFSFVSLLANLTLLRNFYSPSWVWNPPFWFMPLIIGLYISFPFLLKILTKFGPWVLIAVSTLISYGTLALAFFTGLYEGHQSDIFTFWMVQFALGMVLAYIRETTPQRLNLLVGCRAFFLGFVLVICSWGLRTFVPSGKVFNDSITSIGIFLLLLNLVWASRAKVPITNEILVALSIQSYFMYLIHYPIIKFLIGPPLRSPMNPVIVIVLGCIYIALIFLLCSAIYRPMNRVTTWLYEKYT
jgi:peptidoglycan/LPS O-acetylase OafA/YrhL